MENLDRFKVTKFPLSELEWSKDLIYFEGPLLSEYRSRNNTVYLKYWCDCNENHNRWLYFKIQEQDRLRLVLGEKSIKEVIVNQPDSFLFIVDEDEVTLETYMVGNDEIPKSYIPSDDSFLDISEYIGDTNITSMVFEDEWNIDLLKELFKKFKQVFDFIYVSNNKSINSTTLPWLGGFSSVHFYNTLASYVPRDKGCKLEAIYYASPGYMKVKCETANSDLTLHAIKKYLQNESTISEVYSELYYRISDLGLNQKLTKDAALAFYSDNDCKRLYKELSALLLNDGIDWLDGGFDNDFVRSKIIMAHLRRLKTLSSFIRDGSVRVVDDIFFFDDI
ncbi:MULTISPECIES: DUF6575 domain-containing protein [Pseudoalteromonas]|uniref:DUF6575 domain-containing protein n=1 Tax=Pseudoalteromonas TaxID=53246 RepID=UPI000427A660|nr:MULTISPECIES: DUF6575 domain-containing protein [Pseudoalteromonas]|tara:strand:- start:2267 stop:3271 length:1005 start_codon:yes stop_codon:yes gene_type:complete